MASAAALHLESSRFEALVPRPRPTQASDIHLSDTAALSAHSSSQPGQAPPPTQFSLHLQQYLTACRPASDHRTPTLLKRPLQPIGDLCQSPRAAQGSHTRHHGRQIACIGLSPAATRTWDFLRRGEDAREAQCMKAWGLRSLSGRTNRSTRCHTRFFVASCSPRTPYRATRG